MKALVTGATGFIGGHLVDHLLNNGFSVRCLARSEKKADKLSAAGIEVVIGDISVLDDLKGICDGMDYVFHAAAMVNDWGIWDDFAKNTVLGSQNVLRAALQSNVGRFVHISSVDVYDRKYMHQDLPPANEKTLQVHDNWPYYYARAKMLAEREVMYFAKLGLLTSIIRPATVYGPGDQTIMPRVIEFLREQPMLVSNYNPVVGLIYIDDLVHLCLKAAESQTSVGRAYNASSDEDISLIKLVHCICSTMNIAYPKLQLPYWLLSFAVKVFETYGRITKTEPMLTQGGLEFFTLDQRFDISKAQRDLDWHPEVSFTDGFQAYLDSVQKGVSL